MTKKLIYSSVLVIALLSGCGEDTGSSGTPTNEPSTPTNEPSTPNNPSNQNGDVTNKAPIVNAGADKTVTVNETITITGTATDSDGTISNIEWKKGSAVLATTLSFSYTATTVGTDILTLTAMDNDGVTSSDSVNVVVQDVSDNLVDGGKK